MANIQIPNLPAVASLAGEELFEGVQSGTSVKISLNQIVAASRAGTPTTLPFSVDVGGTGATTLTGYVKGNGTAAFTASPTIPASDITGVGTMATQNADAVAITGGSITGITDLAVADGGTGQGSALTQYGMIYGNTTTSMASTAAGTSVQVLHGNASGAPTWGAVDLTTDVTGSLPATNGGTGLIGSLVQYGIVYGSTTTNMASTAAGTSTQVLHGNASGAPTFGAVSLTADVSGTLPLTSGGTGINAVSTAEVNAALMGYTSTATAAATTTLTNVSTQYQLFTGSTTQTVALPVTSTLATGWTFHIVNNSTGSLTVNASSGELVCTVIAGMTAMVTCINIGVTDATAWEFGFTDFGSVTGTGAVVLGTGPTITSGVYSGTVGASNPSTGAFTTVTATSTVSDSAGNVRDIVNNAKTSAYVLALTDNGKMINITTGGVTVNSGIFSAGNNVTIYNNSASSQTVTQGAGVTLRLAGSATTGNRTLALRGICTIVCVASNEFVVSGAGLS